MKPRKDGRYAKKKVINGKAVFFYSDEKTERAAQKDIDRQMLAYASKVEESENFGAIAEEWLSMKKDEVGHKTYLTYKETVSRLGSLANKKIDALQASDVQSIINRLYNQGYSKTVILRAKGVVSMTLDYAIGKNIKVYNFTRSVTIPRNAKRSERSALTDAEIETVAAHVNDEFGLYPFFLMYTGLRRGEALALQWRDVDMEHSIISISKSIEFSSAAGRTKAPKTESGVRQIPILAPLVPYLKGGKTDEYVFGGSRHYSETMIRRRWDKYLSTTGLHITQHQLRHTYATMLYRAQIDAKTAQHLLGHSDVSTTLNIYTHIAKELDADVTAKINAYLQPEK